MSSSGSRLLSTELLIIAVINECPLLAELSRSLRVLNAAGSIRGVPSARPNG